MSTEEHLLPRVLITLSGQSIFTRLLRTAMIILTMHDPPFRDRVLVAWRRGSALTFATSEKKCSAFEHQTGYRRAQWAVSLAVLLALGRCRETKDSTLAPMPMQCERG